MGKSFRWAAALPAIVLALAAVGGCARAPGAGGAGFSDGFASGYARQCVLRAPAAPRRWRGAAYARGYADGMDKGLAACRQEILARVDGSVAREAAYARVDRR